MSVSNEFQAQDMQLQPAGSFVRAKNVACRRRQGAVAKTAHCSKWHFFSENQVYVSCPLADLSFRLPVLF